MLAYPAAVAAGYVGVREAFEWRYRKARIGLGGDYDGTSTLPDGLGDVSRYQDLLHTLSDRGWSRDDLEAVAHRNVLRVMRAVEDGADAQPEVD